VVVVLGPLLPRCAHVGVCSRAVVPESSGQKCLWAAGLVLTRYLEELSALGTLVVAGRTVLELGAGAGLPSIFAHKVLGAALVVASEQPSCMGYLRQNMAANGYLPAAVSVSAPMVAGTQRLCGSDDCTADGEGDGSRLLLLHELDWGTPVRLPASRASRCESPDRSEAAELLEPVRFDLVLGCDVTFNRSLLGILLRSVRLSLRGPDSRCLLCHDDESVPFTHDILQELTRVAALNGLVVRDVVGYRACLEEGFRRPGIHLWHLSLAEEESS
jgi:predicted nicotinamide N-methyase